ncbi:MAG: type secretion outer membrane protein, TolC family [Firmicutes bacterium]|nr:type secretion outer membrane protein, TolC family [Bacillota bacterium]
MNRYNKYCMSLLLSAVLMTAAMQPVHAEPDPKTLTLSDSIALALENNPAMKIAQSNQEKAAWSVNKARAYNGLSLGYNYTLARTDTPASWYNNTTTTYPYSYYFNGSNNVLIDYPEWTKVYNAYQHQLKLTLPVYTGGKIENSINLAKHGSAAADLGTTSAKQQLTMDVTTSYFTVLQARNLEDVASQAVNDLNAHLKNVKNHYDAGTVSLSDVLQTQVRLANARNNLIKAQNSYKMARYKFNKVIGLSLHNEATLADKFSYKPYTPTVDDSIAVALKNRPEMAQANLKIAMANDKVKIADSGNKPTVALVGTETWTDTAPSTSKGKNSWLVGVNVQFNIFDNGLTKTEIKQAKHEVTESQEQTRQLIDKVSLEVCQAYLSVQEAAERITNNQVAVHQSATDYKLAQERYEAGVGTNLDVIDAELAMIQAKTNYIQALYDYNTSRAQLDKAMGTIK